MKALLVDDNFQMLEFMNDCIPWEKKGIQVQLCESGEQAIKSVEGWVPDILITDIDMPDMTGLELISQLHSINPQLESLIVSCHDNFDYAKHAVKLNVSDYLLKDTLDPDKLMGSLDILISKIKEKEEAEEHLSRLQAYIDGNELTLKKNWLRLFLDSPFTHDDKWDLPSDEFGLLFDKAHYIPVIGHINDKAIVSEKFGSPDLLMFALDNVAAEVTMRYNRAISFVYNDDTIVWFVEVKSLLKSNPYQCVKNLITKINHAYKDHLGIHMSFVYDQPVKSKADMKVSLHKLTGIDKEWFYIEGDHILPLSEVNQTFAPDNIFSEYTAIYQDIDMIVSDLQHEKTGPLLDKWITCFKKRRYHPDDVKSLIQNVLINIAVRHRFIYESHSHKAKRVFSQVNSMANTRQLKSYVSGYLGHIIQCLKTDNMTQKEEILKAKRYVEKNSHKKIRMQDVSKYLFMTSAHFSRLFRKETGQTFTEFVIKIKMEKASELLLNTDQTVDEIADNLGYDNTSYFIKVFRKYHLMSPMAYRKINVIS